MIAGRLCVLQTVFLLAYVFVVPLVLLFHVTARLKFAFFSFIFSIRQLSFNLNVDAKFKNLINTTVYSKKVTFIYFDNMDDLI